MKRYTVKITDEALGDMEQLYRYIADVLFAPQSAMNQYKTQNMNYAKSPFAFQASANGDF